MSLYHTSVHIAMAEWLNGGKLRLCDKGRELDRGGTLRLKTNGKLGFAGEERDRQRQADLDSKTSYTFTRLAYVLHHM